MFWFRKFKQIKPCTSKLTNRSQTKRTHLILNLTLKKVNVLCDVKFVFARVSFQVRVKHVVTLNDNARQEPVEHNMYVDVDVEFVPLY